MLMDEWPIVMRPRRRVHIGHILMIFLRNITYYWSPLPRLVLAIATHGESVGRFPHFRICYQYVDVSHETHVVRRVKSLREGGSALQENGLRADGLQRRDDLGAQDEQNFGLLPGQRPDRREIIAHVRWHVGMIDKGRRHHRRDEMSARLCDDLRPIDTGRNIEAPRRETGSQRSADELKLLPVGYGSNPSMSASARARSL